MRHTRILSAGRGFQPMLILPNFFKKEATFSPPLKLHTCISLVQVYQCGQCLRWRLSPISNFFCLVSSRAFRDAPHSPFRCRVSNQFLPTFIKMLLLALLQIYTDVSHLWRCIDLDSAWVRDSRAYQLSFL